jgi:hypothetical protein
MRWIRTTLVGALLAAGCGDDGSNGDETATGTSTGGSTTSGSTTSTQSSGAGSTGTGTSSTTSTGSTSSSGSTSGSTGTDGSATDASTGEFVFTDPTGEHLLGASLVIAPELPLQWTVDASFTPAASGGGTLDLTLQPLALDPGSTDTPRTAVDSPLTYDDIAVDGEGNFNLSLGTVALAGAANPITGADMTINATMSGRVTEAGTLCGTVDGMIVSPLNASIDGSTFGSVGITDTSPQALPDVVASCGT